MHPACQGPYITPDPNKAPNTDKTGPRYTLKLLPHTNATALDLSPWVVEDGTGEFPPLPPGVLVEALGLDDAGGWSTVPLGWGAVPFGDNGGRVGACEGDGDGGFFGELSWTEMAIFWPRQQ